MENDQQTYQSAVDAVGLVAGFSITVIYLQLSLRAAKAGKIARANFVLAGFVIAWTASGLLACLIEFVPSHDVAWDHVLRFAQLGEKTFALLWMIPVLSLWRDELRATGPQRRVVALQGAVALAGIALVVLDLASYAGHGAWWLVDRGTLFRSAFIGMTLPLLAAGWVTLRRRTLEPVTRLSLNLMLLGTLGLTFSLFLRSQAEDSLLAGVLLNAVTTWCPLVIITGVVVLFARFRFADRFIRHCARIVSAATMGILAITVILGFPGLPVSLLNTGNPGFVLMIAGVLTSLILMSYARFDACLNIAVDRFVFPAPDYENLESAFQRDLLQAADKSAAIRISSDFVRTTLRMKRVEAAALSRGECDLLSIPFLNSTMAIAMDPWLPAGPFGPGIEILAPFRLADDRLDVLVIEPGPERRGLVTHEMGFIGRVTSQLSARLQSLRHESTLVESRSREVELRRQITAAELEALRAQINPHFLFNALNTLADLIAVDAARAEEMTLRLARIFRYVLAHSSRPMVSLGEEMEFLRTYLHIEEARFGERLQVCFEVDRAVNALPIPSLILQPLVENALKHGLAPKPGQGRLWIQASARDGKLRMTIEDDGMGLSPAFAASPDHGVGLANTRRRLETQYSGDASLVIEPRRPSGVRVELVLPVSVNAL